MVCLLTQGDGHGQGRSSVTTFHQGATSGYFLKEYNCSIELSWSPFLVRQHNTPDTETLQIDTIDKPTSVWKTADILVSSTGHWWTDPLPSAGKDYHEQGEFVHPHMEESVAFEKALKTWARWVDTNIDPLQTQLVLSTAVGRCGGKGKGEDVSKRQSP
ncbi:protein trichome birefringence-like 1 [Cryptomeria japonica]|uniref:protein trichome birefringence-like 1 n=1 Tax=Cryptomeria japonica TaxID=3369 RepID=UPI0025AC0C42|nr:protein trichome birefringence-like 1 [Cryptomeria japonica]